MPKPMELFWIAGSPFSWRVMLALEAKSIAYLPRLLRTSQGEHKRSDFLALNPRGKAPVLRDGEYVVYESIAIMQYLERRYPERPMFGQTTYETALIWRAMSEITCYLQPPLLRVATSLLTGKAEEMANDVQVALPELHAEMQRLENSLFLNDWLAGDAFTAADATAYPFLKLLLRAAGEDDAGQFELGLLPMESLYPLLATWMTGVERLPGYERTYPPHWRQRTCTRSEG